MIYVRSVSLRAAIAFAAVVMAVGCVPHSRSARHPDLDLLEASWAAYKERFIAADGRVVRWDQNGDTVSEGQAYAMLRAAWMDDQPTFERVWRWTRQHLSRIGRPQSSLMAWHYEPSAGGAVLDWNSATDADGDLALALILAADAWPGVAGRDRAGYLADARAILEDLIELTVVDDAGNRVLLAGQWADQRQAGEGVVLNPSYFSPAWYRHFARITGDHRWIELSRGGYAVLDAICADARTSRRLPDWIRWRGPAAWRVEGRNEGWDAVRIPWRIATDGWWFSSADARRLLASCLTPQAEARYRAAVEPSGGTESSESELDRPVHPLGLAMWSFAVPRPGDRDGMLALIDQSHGEADRYYTGSLAYLPFLARAGRYNPPVSK